MPDPGAKRSYTPREKAQPRLGPGLGGVPSGTVPRKEGEAGYVAPKEVPKTYVLAGKTVSKEEYEQTTAQQLARASGREQAVESMTGTRTMEEFLRKATPQEKLELLKGTPITNILLGSKGTQLVQKQYAQPRETGTVVRTQTGETKFIPSGVITAESIRYSQQRELQERQQAEQQKQEQLKQRIQEGLKKPFYTKENLQAKLAERKQEIKVFMADVQAGIKRHEALKEKYWIKNIPEFPSYEKYKIYKTVTQPSKLISLFIVPKETRKTQEWTTKLEYNVIKGAYEEIKYKPVKTLGLVGLGFVLPPVGTIAGKIPYAPPLLKGGGYLLAGAYGVSKIEEVRKEPTIERLGRTIGETGVQVGALGLGAYVGQEFWSKSYGIVKKFYPGKTKVAPETIVERSILSGEKTFPTAPPIKHYEIFIKSKYKLPGETKIGVWHATAKPFPKVTKTIPGTSEIPGLYTAPSISAYFLRIKDAGYKPFGFELPAIREPTALRIYPYGIKKGLPGEPGYAYVPGIKTEVEAVIPPETPLIKISDKYYTNIWGETVLLPQYEVAGKGITGKTISYEQLMKEYYGEKPLISPYGLSTQEYKPKYYEIPPSKVYSISSLKNYISTSVQPSKVSYQKPSKKYVSKPSSGISQVSSITGISSTAQPPSYISDIISRVSKISRQTQIGKYPSYKRTEEKYITPPPPPTREEILKSAIKKIKAQQVTPGFMTFAKVKGDWLKISTKPLTRAKAIKLGEQFVGKQSLSASFRIVPTKNFITGETTTYEPGIDIWRPYLIRKGKRIPQLNTWIERARYRIEKRGLSAELPLIIKAKQQSIFFGGRRTEPSKGRRPQKSKKKRWSFW